MERVLVLGCAGAGKSTFAIALAARTGLPLVHLDQHYWRPGWAAPDKAAWAAQVEALLQARAWILDGNYGGTLVARLRHADTALFLDLSRWRCLWRVVWRTLRSLGRVRRDMPAGCPERFDWAFLGYIWSYPARHRPRVLAALQGFDGRFERLRSPSEIKRFLAQLPAA